MNGQERERPLSPKVAAAFACWLGIVAAFLEVLILYVKKRQQPLTSMSEDVVWMAPFALLAVILAVVAVGLALGRVSRRAPATVLGVFAASSLASLNVLLLVPGLAHFAAALLAAGLAVQITRVVRAHADATERLMRRTAVWLVAGFVVAGGLMWFSLRPAPDAPATRATAPSGSPNVLLITLDTVRAANLGAYGYARATMPELARFGERGIVFEQALSTAPWTLPSHASLFTGRWPHELTADHAVPLDDRYPTLAEVLAARGYTTAGFVANLKYCSAITGLARGFDHYEDYQRSPGQIAASSTLTRNVADNFRLRRLIRDDEHLNRITAEDLNTRALAWISANGGSPFFMFLNYFDAHEPYLPPPPFDRQFGPGRALGRHSPLHHWLWNPSVGHEPLSEAVRQEEMDAYDGALAYLDRHVGRLLDDLDRQGVLNNTVVVITSDHGEEFAEHGVYEHGYSLYKAGVHVPLLVVAPGRAPAAQRVAAPVSLRDLPATIVDLLGVGHDAPFPGASLAMLWRQNDASINTASVELSPLFSEVTPSPGQPGWFPSSKGDMKAIVHQGLRYIRNGDGTEELYDFAADPWERTNLAAMPERQPALAEARAALARLAGGS